MSNCLLKLIFIILITAGVATFRSSGKTMKIRKRSSKTLHSFIKFLIRFNHVLGFSCSACKTLVNSSVVLRASLSSNAPFKPLSLCND